MRLATHSHHHVQLPHLQLSAKTRLWLKAGLSVMAPYAIAAVFLFAHHEQWFK